MQYGLKRLVLSSSSFLPISVEQYQEIKKAKMVLLEALYLEQKFDFFVENYIEFEETLLKTGIHDMILGNLDHQWFYINRGIFDRRIMNLLTTAISYSDSAKHHLNIIFSRDKNKVEQAMASFSQEYDTRIGYRTMCKLRNFVQHQGLPVHGMSYKSHWLDQSGKAKGLLRFTVDPYLQTEELRAGAFNKTILKELEAQGEKIELKPMIRDYVEGLSKAHATIRQSINEYIDFSNEVLEKSVLSFQEAFPDEGSIVGLAAVTCDENQSYKNDLAIIREPDAHRAYLAKKNPALVNLARRYVSSEIVPN
ncbi:MAG: hypothetical protein V4495_17500 [Pseudomonadota bacterium]